MSGKDRAWLDALMLEGLTSGRELSLLAREVCGETGLEIALLDLNKSIILHAPDAPDCSGARPFIMPDRLGDERAADMLREGRTMIDEAGGRWRACCPMMAPEGPVGFSIAECMREEDAELARQIAERFAQLFVYLRGESAAPVTTGSYLEAGFARELLLHGEDISGSLFTELYMHAPNAALRFEPGFSVAALRLSSAGGGAKLLEEAEQSFARLAPRSFRLISGDMLLIFLYGIGEADILPVGESFSQLELISERFGLVCGISAVFKNLSERKGRKLQAMEALRLAQDGEAARRLCPATSAYRRIIISGASRHIGRQMLELSDIRRLAEYDAANGTEHLETLERYLACGNRLTTAATSMFIDRSTLKYRLEKIKDIISCDFDRPEDAGRLRLGLEIHRLSCR